jgi:hypothetical protein
MTKIETRSGSDGHFFGHDGDYQSGVIVVHGHTPETSPKFCTIG